MTTKYFVSKAEAEAAKVVAGEGDISWTFTKHTPWCLATGADIITASVDADKEAVKAYAKLNALKSMTPTQIATWVDNNVTNLTQAQDAIKTLAIAIGYLIREL